MVLTIKLFATFRTGRFSVAERQYSPETDIAAISENLGIPKEDIGIILVNGRHAELDYQPSEGEIVSLFPLLGGG